MPCLIVHLYVMHWNSSQGCTLLPQSNIKTWTQALSQRTIGIMSSLFSGCSHIHHFLGIKQISLCHFQLVSCRHICKLWWKKYGFQAKSQIDGNKFTDVTLHCNDKVKTVGAKSNTIKIRGQNTVANPTLLFNRITCILNKSEDMEAFLAYELAPQPPFLFHDGAICKPVKRALGNLLKSFCFRWWAPTSNCCVPSSIHLWICMSIMFHILWSTMEQEQLQYLMDMVARLLQK